MAKKAAAPKKEPKESKKKPEVKKESADTAQVVPKAHDRKIKKSEAELLEQGRRLAVNYIAQRDGLEEEIAQIVVDGMDPAAINELIAEANVSVLDRTAKSIAAKEEDKGATIAPSKTDEPKVFPSFLTVPVLAEFETEGDNTLEKLTIPELMFAVAADAKVKNEADKRYKANKKKIIGAMTLAKVSGIEVLGFNMERYLGSSPATIDEMLLIEAGVSIDIIKKCYKPGTPWEDVRITKVKEPKVAE